MNRVISFRADDGLIQAIIKAAQAENMTVSEYTRRAVKWALILTGGKA